MRITTHPETLMVLQSASFLTFLYFCFVLPILHILVPVLITWPEPMSWGDFQVSWSFYWFLGIGLLYGERYVLSFRLSPDVLIFTTTKILGQDIMTIPASKLRYIEAKPATWLFGAQLIFHFEGDEVEVVGDTWPRWAFWSQVDVNAIGSQVAEAAQVNFKRYVAKSS